jgi:hypothetical protein
MPRDFTVFSVCADAADAANPKAAARARDAATRFMTRAFSLVFCRRKRPPVATGRPPAVHRMEEPFPTSQVGHNRPETVLTVADGHLRTIPPQGQAFPVKGLTLAAGRAVYGRTAAFAAAV